MRKYAIPFKKKTPFGLLRHNDKLHAPSPATIQFSFMKFTT